MITELGTASDGPSKPRGNFSDNAELIGHVVTHSLEWMTSRILYQRDQRDQENQRLKNCSDKHDEQNSICQHIEIRSQQLLPMLWISAIEPGAPSSVSHRPVELFLPVAPIVGHDSVGIVRNWDP